MTPAMREIPLRVAAFLERLGASFVKLQDFDSLVDVNPTFFQKSCRTNADFMLSQPMFARTNGIFMHLTP